MKPNGFDKYLDYQYRRSGGFYKSLFDTIKKADPENTERLRKGFPEEVDAYLIWTRVGVEEFAKKCSPGNPLLATLVDEYDLKGF